MDDTVKMRMRQAIVEIRRLRQENEILRAKDDAFQLAGRLLDAKPPRHDHCLTEDIVWRLEQWIFNEESKIQPQEGPVSHEFDTTGKMRAGGAVNGMDEFMY